MRYNRNESDKIQQVIAAFLNPKPRKKVFGNYRVTPGKRLSYFSQETESGTWTYEQQQAPNVVKREFRETDSLAELLKPRYGKLTHEIESVIAIYAPKADGSNFIAINSDTLSQIGKSCSYGHTSYNQGESTIQERLKVISCPIEKHRISFGAFSKAGSLDTLRLHESDSLGNKLLSVTRDASHVSLLVQPNDVIFELPKVASSIADALDQITPLKAKGEKRAIQNGKYFFVPDAIGPKSREFTDKELLLMHQASNYGTRNLESIADLYPKNEKRGEALIKLYVPQKSDIGQWELVQRGTRYVQNDGQWYVCHESPCELLK